MAENSLLYNKYRPILFSQVGGNREVTDIMKNLVKNNEMRNVHTIISGCVTSDTILKVRVKPKKGNKIPLIKL